MRRFKLFSLFQERVARRMCPSRWSARRRTSWSASSGSAAVESLETRCLLTADYLDPSFGVGGKVTTAIGTSARARSMAIQSDGHIVVVGETNAGARLGTDFALARYNSDGALSSSGFTDINGGDDDSATSVALQSDDKIVVVGNRMGRNGSGVWTLARYNASGGLDASFYDFGSLMINFDSVRSDAPSVAVTGGRIVVVGQGVLFGYDGRGHRTANIAGNVNSIAAQSDGKFVVAGGDTVARYNSDGSLDSSFDGDGTVTTDFGRNDTALSVALQADGKIVVAGSSGSDFALARYNSDGSLDRSFDGDGKLTTDFAGGEDSAAGVAVQSDGKIVVAGNSDGDFALARYNRDGSLDRSLNGNGKLTTDFGSSQDRVTSMALQADGKIVVAGYTFNGSFNVFALARYVIPVLNEPPTITSANSVSVPENATAIQAVTATDPENDTLSYSLDGGNDAALFAIDAVSGALSFKSAPDFENPTDSNHDNTYAIQVEVSDGTNIVTQTISVTVTGTNDNNPVFTSSASPSVAENTLGALTLTATDADLPAQTLTWESFSIVGGEDQTKFGISSGSVLVFASPPDFESPTDANGDNVYVVQLQASDGNGGTSATQTINVTVTGINDNAPVITSAATASVAENTTSVRSVTATDADLPAQTVRFSIVGGADESQFSITSGGVLTLATPPDFKTPTDANHDNIYEVQVAVSDGTNLAQQTIAVTVTDTNEAATITSASSVNVAENTTAVLTVSGTDPEHGALTYSLAGGADDSLFSLNLTTGALAFLAAPNFESPQDTDHNNVYEVRASVSDGTNTVTQDIHITVTNVDETPSITSANAVSVLENTNAVLTVSATDPQNDSLSYSLTGGADQTLFNIDPDSGAVSFKSAPNFENPTDANHDNVYSVQVQVSDGTNLVSQNLSITVANVDESPTITSANTASIAENSTFVVTVTGSDPEGHSPHFGITGGTDQSKFTLNFLTGALSFVSPPDFEHPTDANQDNVYVVQVAVSDGTHLVTQDISVTVTNVNETVTIPLPANGGNFKTLFLNGQLHLRSSLGKQLIAPVTLPSGADVQFNGSNAADRLTLDRSWSSFTGSLTFNGNGGNDLFDARTVSLGVTFNGGDGNDTFLGGSGDDTTNGGMGLDSLSGNDGNDSLTGGDGNDKLFGGAGGDIITGDAGTDSLSGGDDDDSLSGGDANDTLNGDAGNDTVTGGAGADIINGGDDDDLLFGNAGNDTIDGGRGDDVIDGGDDNDNLKGSDGDDAIRGNNGNDTLSGGNGNDLLTGSAGNDSLKGDAGIDTLLGDAGNDTLDGGLDIDIINGVLTDLSRDTINDLTKVHRHVVRIRL